MLLFGGVFYYLFGIFYYLGEYFIILQSILLIGGYFVFGSIPVGARDAPSVAALSHPPQWDCRDSK